MATVLERFAAILDPRPRAQRVIGQDGERYGVDLLALTEGTAASRRGLRSNADVAAMYAAIFAAIRWRSVAITKPIVVLQRRAGREWVDIGTLDEPDLHPALAAIHAINDTLTASHGFGLIEQHKLTYGKAYWVKRRSALRVPVEFDIWQPDRVEVRPSKTPGRIQDFRYHKANGSVETVAPVDMIYFRHIIDPRNPLDALSPIGAVRLEAEASLEAQRYNMRFFDKGFAPSLMLTSAEIEAGEATRIEQDVRRKWGGTDNAHSVIVMENDLKPVIPPMSQKDMEFLGSQRWTVEEAARVFELSPLALKDFTHATYQNADQAASADWSMIVDQLNLTLEELTEWYLWPDFGKEYRFQARTENIPSLQQDQKTRAEVDEINLRSGKAYINELRERDGEDRVAWGDLPIVPTTLKPLGYEPPKPEPPPIVAPPKGAAVEAEEPKPPRARELAQPNVEDEPLTLRRERAIMRGWEQRLGSELRGIIRHLDAAHAEPGRKRQLEPGDVDSYDWDWAGRYAVDVGAELGAVYAAVLAEAGFVETPMLGAQELSARWASARAGEMLRLAGRESVVATTRARVQELVAKTIRDGDSLRQLKNELRQAYEFQPARAETIARTETAQAIGQGRRQSAMSRGQDEKHWTTAGDDRVDSFGLGAPCRENAAAGWIKASEGFPSGHDTVPAHPRCRCDVEYRTGDLQ